MGDWTVTKTLSTGDINEDRLALDACMVRSAMLPYLNTDREENVRLVLRDYDDGNEYYMILNLYMHTDKFHLTGNWKQNFVQRKNLVVGQKFGICWNPQGYIN
ncbi:hypothetical protein BVC80_9081g61 [Macleaya cordata]|uniref:TF-B3 domain-containing protein n=1 Tax=Macleaya cordata TaxID=56857 RepID=A0A200PRS8_MACCD|nr:hypothetical protein BVC80_9081g61 [Macleaya cordata]